MVTIVSLAAFETEYEKYAIFRDCSLVIFYVILFSYTSLSFDLVYFFTEFDCLVAPWSYLLTMVARTCTMLAT